MLCTLNFQQEEVIVKESKSSTNTQDGVAKSESDNLSSLLVRLTKYLWVLSEDTLLHAKVTTSVEEFAIHFEQMYAAEGKVFTVTMERFFKFLCTSLPIFAYQTYPSRLLAKKFQGEDFPFRS